MFKKLKNMKENKKKNIERCKEIATNMENHVGLNLKDVQINNEDDINRIKPLLDYVDISCENGRFYIIIYADLNHLVLLEDKQPIDIDKDTIEYFNEKNNYDISNKTNEEKADALILDYLIETIIIYKEGFCSIDIPDNKWNLYKNS